MESDIQGKTLPFCDFGVEVQGSIGAIWEDYGVFCYYNICYFTIRSTLLYAIIRHSQNELMLFCKALLLYVYHSRPNPFRRDREGR